MHPDWTELNNLSGKINYQLNSANRFQFLLNLADKVRNARGADDDHPPETVYVQTSGHKLGTPTYNLKHTWVLSDKLGVRHRLQPHRRRVHPRLPGSQSVSGTCSRCSTTTRAVGAARPTGASRVRGRTPRSRPTAATSSRTCSAATIRLKFGVRYKFWETGSGGHVGGNAIAVLDDIDNNDATPVAPDLVQIFRDGNTLSKTWTYGGYIQDNFSRGKLRLNLGLRYDFQDGLTKGTCVPSSTFAPEILPAFCWNGADETRPWKDWGPRISATYDLFGTGKTVLKASYAEYFEQAGLINTLGGNPAGEIELNAPWNDLNGDTVRPVQRSGLDPARSRRRQLRSVDGSAGAGREPEPGRCEHPQRPDARGDRHDQPRAVRELRPRRQLYLAPGRPRHVVAPHRRDA